MIVVLQAQWWHANKITSVAELSALDQTVLLTVRHARLVNLGRVKRRTMSGLSEADLHYI